MPEQTDNPHLKKTIGEVLNVSAKREDELEQTLRDCVNEADCTACAMIKLAERIKDPVELAYAAWQFGVLMDMEDESEPAIQVVVIGSGRSVPFPIPTKGSA